MSLLTDSTIGIEDVQRQALFVLADLLPDALGAIQDRWTQKDIERNERLGLTADIEPTVLEPILPENMHEGHVPSLIKAPVTAYPNVAVMVNRAGPAGETDLYDHAHKYVDTLQIEVMVRALNERDANRRVRRTAEAANLCIQANPTLYGEVEGLSTTPTVDVANVFLRRDKEHGHYGNEWYWCGAQLTYAVRKSAGLAYSSDGFLRSAGTDQAP